MNAYKLRGVRQKEGGDLLLLAAAQEQIHAKCQNHTGPFRMVRLNNRGDAVEPGPWLSVAEGLPRWSGRLANARPDETYRLESKRWWQLYIYVRPATNGMRILSAGLSQLGVPYIFGAESPNHAFDCSGLTDWAYNTVGRDLPHSADEQMNIATFTLNPEQGDLVFFHYPSSPKPPNDASHVGLWYRPHYVIDTRNPNGEPVAIRAIEEEFVLHYGYIKGVTH